MIKDISSLKLNIDKADIGKLQATPIDLSKLSNAVKNYSVKKIVHDQVVKKVNTFQINYTNNSV